MEKHYDIIDVRATNRLEATEIVLDFLKSYKKRGIRIFKVKRRNNHFQAEVRYYDDYDIESVFVSKDFNQLSNDKVLSLNNRKY